MTKTRIGFDFDKVFVDYPPFVPSSFIEFLYKKKNSHLSYRIPGKYEQSLRLLTHHPILRQPIKSNVEAVSKIFDKKNADLYIISSRFSFLKKRTDEWNKKNKMNALFKQMFFNFNNIQPHEFKEKIIRENKIEKFIDDDLELLQYLSGRNPKVKFYWIFNGKAFKKLPKNIKHIKDINEFLLKHV